MDFIHITFIDIIDILMVAAIMYQIYKLIRGTAAINIFVAIILLYFLYLIVKVLKMEMMSLILGQFIEVGVLALIILFQQEIRRFLLHIGTNYMQRNSKIRWLISGKTTKQMSVKTEDIMEACRSMSESKTGALIVIARRSSLDLYAETGDIVDADLSQRLLQNIFFKNAPLHDGAVIILGERIYAARCTLPTTENPNIPAHYGTRHKAALGISELTDAVVAVVSEETGSISYVENGIIKSWLTAEKLKDLLDNALKV
ncbi:MAG: diadenylate cyclase CdaA [Prevotellaceae bacterium]|jgi:uncharacterized protein (TIGR00159 family)|nr:diadenylate cyclase CdaA [Prevotellaceae bacterium]